MKLTKAQRAILHDKYCGRCAYCGCELPDRWHADHIEPIVRNDWLAKSGDYIAPSHPDRDTLENMNPACPPCNIDKHSMSLESWRTIIKATNEVLMRDSATFRRAIRFNTIHALESSVIFYFETQQGGV